ncbi:hypothetical protein MJO29_008175 [Puccinia striiformis f. sp. tritici]|uniref:Uncharacterized protein n=1 Tax=Puccinia striiformis f. sp. tritici PST-78 TaxID=1165861 RepID=A0A0L0VMT7_9BASI|nr:uncharacterized protein Pst134EA_031272 [Puccinia striiformis f. sp. tritici]XP_047805416.1 hypothetical protein Pst134EA_015667 [Puccinia striiformis f. sp. tritici]KAI9602612.1 hypothetical protein H4Q26_001903 [Puccinia striiformis f. sp. tritici PST-130]KNF00589.1 hypothetical protein PSTG_06283 [Puccinia striiformis f. sp. tritici PST-78]KAH9443437.1 hypothetical protein Pst134EA_031272 [Puccinia striiformis f. sp. tritici]KAH9452824.1 hypothetical protein Pst134EB_016776 [Puccinia str
MAEFVIRWSAQTDKVLEEMDYFTVTHSGHDGTRRRATEKVEITEAELDKKNKLLEKLQWSLVPLIRDQINTFLRLLDMENDWRNQTEPKLQLIHQHLLKLDRTLIQTKKCLEFAAVDVKQVGTHDHHLKRCKQYTYDRIMHYVWYIIRDLHAIFFPCVDFVEESALSIHEPEDPTHPKKALLAKSKVLQRAAECRYSINKAIRLFEGSDFDFIQDGWEEKEASFNTHLESLTRLTRQTNCRPGNTTALKQHLLKLVQFTIPLIKLVKILFRKISCRNTHILPVTLDVGHNSEALSKLHVSGDTLLANFGIFVGTLVDRYNGNPLHYRAAKIHNQIMAISQALHSILLDLPLYLIPLQAEIDCSRKLSDFKTWLCTIQEASHCMTINILSRLPSFDYSNQPELAPDLREPRREAGHLDLYQQYNGVFLHILPSNSYHLASLFR